jgi:hypothetical protein
MAGVEEDVVMAEEVDGEVFVGGVGGEVGGVAKGGVPAGFGVEKFEVGVGVELGLEKGEIFLDAGEELWAKKVALGEERGESGLGGRTEGEEGVGDDFEAIEGGADLRRGAGDGKPGDFHLGESGNFGEAAEGEGQDFGVGGEGFARSAVEGEVQEDFVDDQGKIVFFANGVEASEFLGLDVGAGGIVGMDEENGASAWSDGVLERLEIDEPAVGVGEGVGDEADVLEAGEEFEEGVAGLGEEEFVAGVCEEAEGVGVGLACAGGEEDGFGIESGLVIVKIVAGDFLAGGESAFGLGVVGEGGGILEGGKDGGGIVVEIAVGRIGGGEIEEWDVVGAELVESESEGVAGEGPVGAVGEHGGGSF